MIKSLKIQNFKSLRDVEIRDFPSFMVVVGANAAGKSNFVKALDFLFHVMTNGLANTIDDFGGYENICYRHERRSRGSILFSLRLELPLNRILKEFHGLTYSPVYYFYSFEFKASGRSIDAPYVVVHENFKVQLQDLDNKANTFSYNRRNNEIVEYSSNGNLFGKNNFSGLIPPSQEVFIRPELHSSELLLVRYAYGTLLSDLFHYFKNCRAYYLTPDAARQPVGDKSAAGTILNNKGSNLASVIKYFKTENKSVFDNILEHLQVTAPMVEAVNPQYTDSKLLSYNIKETGIGRPWHPNDVSDGTIKSLTLFIPLEDNRLAIVAYDEPENSIHPWIQKHFVQTCLEKSAEKQIILATHSIALVDEVPPESFYIIQRGKNGGSEIVPATKEHPEIKEIIEEKILTLGEYWKSGALGGVPTQLMLEFEENEK